jgi:hypothetical protein
MKERVEKYKVRGDERERNRKRRRWKRKGRRKMRTTVMKTGRIFSDVLDLIEFS